MNLEEKMDFKDNFSVKNKWIADIPLSKVSDNLNNISIHLAEFTIPSISVATTIMAYKGVSIEIPTKIIQPSDRNITFSYMVDLNWLNYYSLYQWSNLMSPLENITPLNSLKQSYSIEDKSIKSIPINVFLINQYKKPILKITYNNCWVKGFNELALSYQDEPEVVKHGFTCAYSDFKLELINE